MKTYAHNTLYLFFTLIVSMAFLATSPVMATGSYGTISGYYGGISRYGFDSMEEAALWGYNNSILLNDDRYTYGGLVYYQHAAEGAPPADGWTNWWWGYLYLGYGPYYYYAIGYLNDRYYLEVPQQPRECVGNPCDPITGSKIQVEQDIPITPDGLSFTRYYHSGSQPEGDTTLGKGGWRHNFLFRIDRKYEATYWVVDSQRKMGIRSNEYLSPEEACTQGWSDISSKAYRGMLQAAEVSYDNRQCHLTLDGKVLARIPTRLRNPRYLPDKEMLLHTVSRPNGRVYTFEKLSDQWHEITQAPVNLVSTENGWNFTDRNGMVEVFNEQGLLVSRTDLAGHTTEFEYNNLGLLIRVIGYLGYQLEFEYDLQQYLIAVTGPDGRVEYGYDTTYQRLTSVTYPDESSKTYHYENGGFLYHLTGITDEKGNRFATWAYDTNGRAILSEHAEEAEKTELIYNIDGTTTVKEYRNEMQYAERTYEFTVVNGASRVKRLTGDPCDSCTNGHMKEREYDDLGHLIQYTDWEGNVTTFTRDTDGRELSRTEAVGTLDERTVTTTWDTNLDKPLTITEPHKITEFNYDVAGRLLSRQERDIP